MGLIPILMNSAPQRVAARIGLPNFSRMKFQRTGIASLKVRFNSVFGYYIEVTKSNLDKVPAHYVRKQTISKRRTLYHFGA